MKEKVLCPFTGGDCRFYKRPPNPEMINEKSIMYWCFLCLLGQIAVQLKEILVYMPKDRR